MAIPEALREIENRVRECKRCSLWEARRNPVPGEGGFERKILLVGEAPGKTEDEMGRPFVGKAGKLLDELLELAGLSRKDVYITNVLKCRPPNNRDPKQEEITACSPFLEEQIRILDPSVIVTLGRFSWEWMCKKMGLEYRKLSDVHGRVFCSNTIVYGRKIIIPMYHPATALYRAVFENDLKADFSLLGKFLK